MFLTHIALPPEKVGKIVMACCALHNYLRTGWSDNYLSDVIDREDDTHQLIEGAWRHDPTLAQAALLHLNNPSVHAKERCEYLCHYRDSKAPWQWDKI